jgi:hypothetical protein
MAKKSYVKVTTSVKPTGNLRPKSTLNNDLKRGMENAVNASSKLTTDRSAEKNVPSFAFDGTLHLKCVGKMLDGQLTTTLSQLPQGGVFATGHLMVGTEVRNPAKINDDFDFVVDEILKQFKAKVIKQFESRVP